jgi:ThiF family
VTSHLGTCAEFYRERDHRTEAYLGRPWVPEKSVRVAIGHAAAQTEAGQHLLLTLTNLLARVHRRTLFTIPPGVPVVAASLVQAESLCEAVISTSLAIDPCGSFELSPRGGEITLGIGVQTVGMDWYLGADRAIGLLQTKPVRLDGTTRATLVGAGLAACLGAAAAFKMEIGCPVTARRLSAWNYREAEGADPGSDRLDTVDVGRTLLVGAGAVGAALTYWLWSWGAGGAWTVVDQDRVKLHNTNRGMLFLPADAGWPAGEDRSKAELVARFLPRARIVDAWYDLAPEALNEQFDVILALANERDFRHQIAHRNATVVLHATTGRNWLSQLHRHVAGSDDCIWCRLGEVREVAFQCSTAEVTTPTEERVDAALPFLSAASGLMLATLLQRLATGRILDDRLNNWRWDFLSENSMTSAGRSRCNGSCGCVYSPNVRRTVNAGTAWAHLDVGAKRP